MIAVAVAGGLLGAERLRKKSVAFGAPARFHAAEERRYLAGIRGEEAAYFARCRKLIERGIPLSRAEIHAGLAEAWASWPELRRRGNDPNNNICRGGEPAGYDARLAWNLGTASERAAHHGRLKRRYERAAWHPWLPVAPNPPEPR
jgi:hypothetical protein